MTACNSSSFKSFRVSSFTLVTALDVLQNVFEVRVNPDFPDDGLLVGGGFQHRRLRCDLFRHAVELALAYFIDEIAQGLAADFQSPRPEQDHEPFMLTLVAPLATRIERPGEAFRVQPVAFLDVQVERLGGLLTFAALGGNVILRHVALLIEELSQEPAFFVTHGSCPPDPSMNGRWLPRGF